MPLSGSVRAWAKNRSRRPHNKVAILIRADGSEARVFPLNGQYFTRDEIQRLLYAVDLDEIEVDADRVMIGDARPGVFNARATQIVQRTRADCLGVTGTVLLAERKDIQWLS